MRTRLWLKAVTLLLLLLTLLGCASEIQHSNTSGTVAEKQGEEQKQKPPMPIITYRGKRPEKTRGSGLALIHFARLRFDDSATELIESDF